MKNSTIQLNLRAARAKAELSLSKTAELTGVSKAMLGQIERGESSPTLATLWKLAKGFHLPLTALIEDLAQTPEVISPAQSHVMALQGSIRFRTVFPFDPILGAESFLLTLDVGQSYVSQPHGVGVIEDIFVVSGKMELLYNEKWHRLKIGDATRFNADQDHGYRNLSDGITKFYNTIHYPKTGVFNPPCAGL